MRLRYYIPHRLIKHSGALNLDGRGLPAPELEPKVAEVIRPKLLSPSFLNQLIPDAFISETGQCRVELTRLCDGQDLQHLLNLVHTIKVKTGELRVTLDPSDISNMSVVKTNRIAHKAVTITSRFQIRKRGVERKLVLGGATAEVDETLIQNIAKAHHWFEQDQIRPDAISGRESKRNDITSHPATH